MKIRRTDLIRLAVGMAVLWLAAPAFALDLREALERGAAHSEKILAARAAYDSARMERNSALGNFGPSLKAEGSALWLDVHSTVPETQAMTLPPDVAAAMDPTTAAVFNQLFASLDFSEFTAVPDRSDTLTLSAYQPLTPLFQIGSYNAMAKDGREIARLTWEVTGDNVGLLIASAYFQVLNAQKGVVTYESAAEQMTMLVHDAQGLTAQGMMIQSDLLKFEMRARDVDVQLERARQDLALAKSNLGSLLDLPADQIECAEVDWPLQDPKPLDYYVENGRKDRRELEIATLAEKAARSAKNAKYLDMVPQIGAVASAEWNDDGLDFSPDRTYAAGFALNWNFWGWGTRLYSARAADYAAAKARHEAVDARREIMLSIEKAWRDDVVAHRLVEAYALTVQQAEESYRIENSRFKVGKTTATDLMIAQTQLTSAKTVYHAGRYGAVMADAALLVSIGQPPFPTLTGGTNP